MAALFSCTKCHSRHPFDALSDGEQLCRSCKNNYPTVKCTYCRAEFQQESKSSTNTICKKCAQNVKAYGKPSACEYCSILAAFIGKKCQRCTYSEKKWGAPLTCEQCKQKCAFDRTEESKKKVGGKVLCWLCTLAYKRAVAKALQKSSALGAAAAHKRSSLDARIDWISANNSHGVSESHRNPAVDSVLNQSNSANTGSAEKPTAWNNSGSNGSAAEKTAMDKQQLQHNHQQTARDRSKHRHHHKSKHHHSRRKSAEDEDSPAAKKSKTEVTSTPNGVSTPKSNMPALEAAGMDSVASDHLIVITQLKDQVESLKKQLLVKDQQLMEKDKKITELKAQMYEQEKDARVRVQSLQKQQEEAVQELQVKNRELTRQVKILSKGKKIPSSISSPQVL